MQYINAETTAGGIAHWATSEVAGNLRTNDTDWQAAWQDYINGIIDVTAPNQISSGGPVIGSCSELHTYIYADERLQQQFKLVCEANLVPYQTLMGADNEYSQSPISHAEYFAELEEVYRNSDIVVPLTYNDPGEGRNFINGTVGFDCSSSFIWCTHILSFRVPLTYTGMYPPTIIYIVL